MAMVSAVDARKRFNERFKQLGVGGSADDAFASESKKFGYKGGDVDEGQLNNYLTQRSADFAASQPQPGPPKTGGVETVPTGGVPPGTGGIKPPPPPRPTRQAPIQAGPHPGAITPGPTRLPPEEPGTGVPTSGGPGGNVSAFSGLQGAFSRGGGGAGGGMMASAPILDQGMPSPANPNLGVRNLPMQGLRLAMMRGRIY